MAHPMPPADKVDALLGEVQLLLRQASSFPLPALRLPRFRSQQSAHCLPCLATHSMRSPPQRAARSSRHSPTRSTKSRQPPVCFSPAGFSNRSRRSRLRWAGDFCVPSTAPSLQPSEFQLMLHDCGSTELCLPGISDAQQQIFSAQDVWPRCRA